MTSTRYPLYLSLSFAFLASLLACLGELRLRHLIFIPPLPRAVHYDARGHGRSHRAKLEKWTTLLIKYEKQFLPAFFHPPESLPSSSPPSPFSVHVTSATLWVARILPLTSKSQIGRNATLQRYIAPGVWAPARSSRPLNLSLRNSLETAARTATTHGIAKTESDPSRRSVIISPINDV